MPSAVLVKTLPTLSPEGVSVQELRRVQELGLLLGLFLLVISLSLPLPESRGARNTGNPMLGFYLPSLGSGPRTVVLIALLGLLFCQLTLHFKPKVPLLAFNGP